MATRQKASSGGATTLTTAKAFAPLSARRLLVIGGIALVLVGMIFGDIFAVFVLHQNAGRIGRGLLAVAQAIASGNSAAVSNEFQQIGGLLENRGTKVDAHAHVIAFGYLALLLALVQPFVALSERTRKRLAGLLIFGAGLLPVGVFLIHYVGLAYSPLEAIGWASIFADLGGLFIALACAGELVGLWRHLRGDRPTPPADDLLQDRSWCGRVLLTGGTLLILAGFLHGAYYAAVDLYQQEARDATLLSSMMTSAAANHAPEAVRAVDGYGELQADKAVKIAAHAHIIEFGLLAVLLAFLQPFVDLSERWRRTWVFVLLLGSVMLPVFVLAELRWGLVAGGIADVGGLLVVVALSGMLVGVIRCTGRLDAAVGGAR